MNLYKISPHVADVRLNVRGKSYEQLFTVALEGMNRILNKDYEKYLNGQTIIKVISVTSYDVTSLLIDFLSEALTLSHIHKAIFHTIDRLEIHDTSLDAYVLGAKVSRLDEDIKAVTYHEAKVRKNEKGQYETNIVFDI